MSTSPRLGFTELEEGETVPETAVNEIARFAEQGASYFIVKDKDIDDPPGSPVDGDSYIVATASPTGAWTGWGNRIAFYMNTGWLSVIPIEGTRAYVQDENTVYEYSGAAWGTASGAVSYASIAETNAGTEAAEAVTPDGLAGSNFGKAVVSILVSDPNGDAITTGDGKAYWRVPSTCNGMNLVAVAAALITVSSSGIPTVQIHNLTQAADMLTTKLTIDASETDSSTAAAAAVIDGANDDVATGDMLRIDIDVAGTGAKGLMVEMQFQLP